MKVLIFDSRIEAETRSRAEWEKCLGRKKRPEDVTEFLWSAEEGPDGKAALVIPADDEARLSTAERANLATRVAPAEETKDETVRGR